MSSVELRIRAVRAAAVAAALVAVVAGLALVDPGRAAAVTVPGGLVLAGAGFLVAGHPTTRRWVGAVAVLAAVVTFAGTAWWLAAPDPGGSGLWLFVHTGALVGLAVAVARWTPVRWAVVVLPMTVVAEAVVAVPWGTRERVSVLDVVMLCGFWSVGGMLAAGLGVYLRWLDGHRRRQIDEARRAQRLQLSGDLHDFVAHDVAAMVVQVQAARILLDADPGQVAGVLDRIEADGTRALAAMDRTIRLLREQSTGPAPRGALPGAAELPELVERFRARGGRASLAAEPGLTEGLPSDVGATVYRVAVEALTNVRRHAPGSAVELRLARAEGGVELAVSNTEAKVPVRRTRRGGFGLVGLTERVEAVGGRLDAGPQPSGGWRVRVWLPADVEVPR